MDLLYSELRWLPQAPEDFSESLKAVAKSTAYLGGDLQALANPAQAKEPKLSALATAPEGELA
jgi:hypothetical protein